MVSITTNLHKADNIFGFKSCNYNLPKNIPIYFIVQAHEAKHMVAKTSKFKAEYYNYDLPKIIQIHFIVQAHEAKIMVAKTTKFMAVKVSVMTYSK